MKNLIFKIQILLTVALLLGAAPVADAQNADDAPIKVDTVLVNIPFVAADRDGRNISGLTKENFVITQNGEKQNIEFFADEEAPMNVAILIDTSFSTRRVLGDIKDAARDFVKLLRPEDKAMIVAFDYNIKVLSELTPDRKKLRKAIGDLDIGEQPGSRMQDALYQILTADFAAVKGRKAIIVLTDGMVTGRNISNPRLLDSLIESDTLVYPIFFQTMRLFPPNVKTVTLDELKRVFPVNYLNTLALATGGRFFAAGAVDFKTAFQSIADELKKQYVVGFYPQEVEAGTARRIKIAVDRKDVILRTKTIIRLRIPSR